jgi:hypothetical protein
MVAVGVSTQNQAGVRYILRAKGRFHQARTIGPTRIREIRIDIENAVPVFQDKTAVAEPPQGWRIATGVFNFLEQLTSA